jgi:hypothetical protein
MKTALSLVAVATLLIAPNLRASQSAAPVAAVLPAIQGSNGELSSAVQLYLDRGDELLSHRRIDAAIRQYARAVETARREGHLPSWSSWKMANAQYFGGDLVGAAATLDKIANDAALVGDLEVEALALYYAAWLDGKAGRKSETAARIARLEGLLRSRYLPVAMRDRLTDLLRSSKDVALQ